MLLKRHRKSLERISNMSLGQDQLNKIQQVQYSFSAVF